MGHATVDRQDWVERQPFMSHPQSAIPLRDGPQLRCLGPWLASVAQPWRATLTVVIRQYGVNKKVLIMPR